MSRVSLIQQIELFKENHPMFRWCYGKWFVGDEEVAIDDYLLRQARQCGDVKKVRDWTETYIASYGRLDVGQDASWPVLRIVQTAQSRLARGDKPSYPLAFPFNQKELKIINYLLVGDPEYAIFFYGVGGSGKSTILNIIRQLYGDGNDLENYVENVSSAPLQDLGHFNVDLDGKRLWIDDDMAAHLTDSQVSRLKPIVTNAKASIEGKCKNRYNSKYNCKCLFAGNVPLRFDLSDTGMLRRIIYYKKDTKIKNPNPKLAGKEYTKEELINIVMAALSIDMTDWTAEFMTDTHEILMKNNSVYKYGMNRNYEVYKNICYEKGYNPVGDDKFEDFKALFAEWEEADHGDTCAENPERV